MCIGQSTLRQKAKKWRFRFGQHSPRTTTNIPTNSRPIASIPTITLLSLPAELHLDISEYLTLASANALLRTNRYFSQLLTPALHQLIARRFKVALRHSPIWRMIALDCGSALSGVLACGLPTSTWVAEYPSLLYMAVCYGKVGVVQVLLEAGASTVFKGSTMLHVVYEERHNDINKLEVVRMLLEHGVDVNARNWANKTALDIAYEHREDDAALWVLQNCGWLPIGCAL